MYNRNHIKRIVHTSLTIIIAVGLIGNANNPEPARAILDPIPLDTVNVRLAHFAPMSNVAQVATTTVIPVPIIPTATEIHPETTGDSSKMFIYMHESHNDPTRINSIGCYGIGQDCNGIVYNLCGADYSCQDEYFTNYMKKRYGTWDNAKAFWLARVQINGQDVGNWW